MSDQSEAIDRMNTRLGIVLRALIGMALLFSGVLIGIAFAVNSRATPIENRLDAHARYILNDSKLNESFLKRIKALEKKNATP